MRNDSGQQAYRELIETLREAPVRDLAWLLLSADLLSATRFPVALAHFDGVHAAADAIHVPASGDPASASDSAFDMTTIPSGLAGTPENRFHSQWLHDWLLACDADPEPLREFLTRGESHRLGRYAEQLLHFALLHSPRFDLLAAGLQVRDARRGNMTLGECDFLLTRRADRQLLHWELAVKLYLFVPPAPSEGPLDERAARFHWLGPNLADSLADKVARLLGHQLRLTTVEAARSALPAAGPWLPQVYLKGWLFHPLAQCGSLPQVASDTHGRGWWATLDKWWAHVKSASHDENYGEAKQPERAWAMLPRARWLAPARIDDLTSASTSVSTSDVLSLGAMHARIESHWRERGVAEPLLIVSLVRRPDEGGNAGEVWCEVERGFIVPDFWEPRARHRIEELSERAEAAARRALAQSADDGAPSI